MKYYAVIDTNVLVSALITKKEGVATKRIWDYVLDGTIVPLFNSDILAEYSTVLHREHFNISPDSIDTVLKTLKVRGITCDAPTVRFDLIDPDDTVFYAISTSRDDAYLITVPRRTNATKNTIFFMEYLLLSYYDIVRISACIMR